MKGNIQELGNALTVSVDWLSFTVTETDSVDEVLDFMGYGRMDFQNMAHGGKGYRSMVKLNGFPVYVMYDGNPDMGVHVDISGTAMPEIIRAFSSKLLSPTPFGSRAYQVEDFDSTFLMEIVKGIRRIGHVTRLDLAIDDLGGRYFSTDDLVELYGENRVVSKFRTLKNVVEYDGADSKTGHTLYFGSRRSDIFLRVYDKRLEQNKKNQGTEKPPVRTPWVRWELELKGDRAIAVANLLASGKPCGEIAVGVLGNYMRIINLDDCNRSRCSVYDVWSLFVDGLSRLRLYVAREDKTIEDKKRWVKNQVMPTLAAIIMSDGGSLEFIDKNMEGAICRMSRPLREMVSKAYLE